MSSHAKGLLIAALAVLFITPDTLLIRLGGQEYGVTLFWRSLFTAVGLSLLIIAMNGRRTVQRIKALGRPGLLVALLFSLSNLTFLAAVQITTVANTLVIISSAPVFAALIGRAFLHERVPVRMWITTTIVITAIGFIFADGLGGVKWWGNLCALISALTLAITFTMTRHADDIDMTPALAGSSLISMVIAFFLATSVIVPSTTLVIFAILGGFLTLAFTLLFIAPRYIPAAEVSLIMPLETVFGTGLVWIVIGEEPSLRAIIGGSAIIVALTVNSVIGIHQNRIVSERPV